MYVKVNVSAADAIRRNSTTHGPQDLELTQEWLESLTEQERAVLADELPGVDGRARYFAGGHGSSLYVPTADLEAVRAVIQATLAKRAEQKVDAAAYRQKQTERAVTGLRERRVRKGQQYVQAVGGYVNNLVNPDMDVAYLPEECAAEYAAWTAELEAQNQATIQAVIDQHAERERKRAEEEAAKKESERLYAEACEALVREIGTESQLGRLELGRLPAAEINTIVHDHVFAAMGDQARWPRYDRLQAQDIDHDEDCCDHRSVFEAEYCDEWTAADYAAVSRAEKLMPDAQIAVRVHKGQCEECDAQIERKSLQVTQAWHGRNLTREYACRVSE